MNKEIVRGIDENLISLQMAKRPPLDDIEYRTIYSKKGWDMVHFKDNNGDYGMRIFFTVDHNEFFIISGSCNRHIGDIHIRKRLFCIVGICNSDSPGLSVCLISPCR